MGFRRNSLHMLLRLLPVLGLLLLLWLWLAVPLVGAGTREAVQQAVERFAAHPLLREASVGVALRDLATGELLAGFQAEKLFVPASLQKLLIWGTALDLLGPEHSFRTTLRYDPETLSVDGILAGGLILHGGGDPSFGRGDLERMARELAGRGIRRIRGPVIIDSSAFSDTPWGSGWAWDDFPYSFSAPVTAMAVDRNRLPLTLLPGHEPGAPATLQIPPPGAPFVIQNEVITGPPGGEETLQLAFSSPGVSPPVLSMTGAIPLGGSPVDEQVSLVDPIGFARLLLLHFLTREGVAVVADGSAAPREAFPDAAAPQVLHHSPPVRELGKLLLHDSDNFVAEMLLKGIGLASRGKGTFDDGIAAVRQATARLGIAGEEFRMVDGSGLSRYNLLSPSLLTAFLTALQGRPAWEPFHSALPGPGEGTLARRLETQRAPIRFWGKTGTMTGISNLAGYLGTGSTPRYALAVFINGSLQPALMLRPLEDGLVVRLTELLLGEPSASPVEFVTSP